MTSLSNVRGSVTTRKKIQQINFTISDYVMMHTARKHGINFFKVD